jgi:hypothetical protein
MVIKKDILTALDDVTDKLSSQVRTTALGVLALSWGLLVGDSPAAKAISADFRAILVVLGGASVAVLFLDFLQYFAGYFSTKRVLDEVEDKGEDQGEYDSSSLAYQLRRFFFWAKQFALMLTVVTLLVTLGRWALFSR